jgi:hypothetical protein
VPAKNPLNPDENPKSFLTIVLAAGLKIFGPARGTKECFDHAEEFIKEAELRYGKLGP